MVGDRIWPVVDPGIWLEARPRPSTTPRPGLFLDRDGVVIVDSGFVAAPEDVELLPGAAELVAEANRCAVPVAVVTNQSGIARQRFGWAEFAAVQREIARQLAVAGAWLDAVLACPFHPEFTSNYGETEAHWRKPGPGLIIAASRRLNIDPPSSWLVGDQPRDIDAAKNAGLAGAVLLNNGPECGSSRAGQSVADTKFRNLTANTLSRTMTILKDAGLLVE